MLLERGVVKGGDGVIPADKWTNRRGKDCQCRLIL